MISNCARRFLTFTTFFPDSVSWDPLPRPSRPSATPQAKPPAVPLAKKASPTQKPQLKTHIQTQTQTQVQTQVRTQKRKQNRGPVLLVIPNEPVGPLRPKPRLKSKSAGAADDVSKETGDVSKARDDIGKARAPLQAKGELLNAMPVNRPVADVVKKADRPAGSQKAVGKLEREKRTVGPGLRDATSASSVATERKKMPVGPLPAREVGDGERSAADGAADPGKVPISDVSPRQPGGAKRLPSSKIPRPGGTPGMALGHRARHSLRFGAGAGGLLRAAKGAAGASKGEPRNGGEGGSVSAGSRYAEECEEVGLTQAGPPFDCETHWIPQVAELGQDSGSMWRRNTVHNSLVSSCCISFVAMNAARTGRSRISAGGH